MREANNSLRLPNPWPSNSRSNWNLEMLSFEEGGKPENLEKNPHMTPDPGTYPGHIGGRNKPQQFKLNVNLSSIICLHRSK